MRQLFLAACFFEAGLLLIVLPWTVLWERNYLLAVVPWVFHLSQSAYVRGAVTGLGLVNVGIGVSEVGRIIAARFSASGEGRRELHPRSDVR